MNIAMHTNFRVTQRFEENFRAITCAQAECDAFKFGWSTVVPVGTADQVRVISRNTGRFFTEKPTADGLIEFIFAPGQEGFKGGGSGEHDHRERIDSVQRFSKQDGHAKIGIERNASTWLWSADGTRQQLSPQSWVDAFGENQERLAAEAQKG